MKSIIEGCGREWSWSLCYDLSFTFMTSTHFCILVLLLYYYYLLLLSLFSERRFSSAKLRKFTDVCMLGEQVWAPPPPPPHYKNVCKISRHWGVKPSLVFNKSFSNLAILLILRRSFQWCRRIFTYWSMLKLKKPWKDLFVPRGAGTLSNPQLVNVNSHLLKQRLVVIPTNDGQYLEIDKTVSLSGKP